MRFSIERIELNNLYLSHIIQSKHRASSTFSIVPRPDFIVSSNECIDMSRIIFREIIKKSDTK